jgi:hypothetical protein
MRALLSWLLVLGSCEAGIEQDPPAVRILFFNYAGVSGRALSQAQNEATRVLRNAGVRAEWVDCPTLSGQERRLPDCTVSQSSRTVQLRLLTASMMKGAKAGQATLGTAILPFQGDGMVANVFPSRAEQVSANRSLGRGVILGHLMAHELGHLLLGAGSHSSCGLMRNPWGKAELTWAAQGSLNFSSAEAERIRARLRSHS